MNSIVLLSGGQDSTTTLAFAAKQSNVKAAVNIQYGQRHKKEAEYAERWANEYGVPFLSIDMGHALHGAFTSSLTGQGDMSAPHPNDSQVPASFVPARNIIFISVAAAVAHQHDADAVYVGVSAADNSGYPDCREDTIKSLQTTLRLGLNKPHFQIVAPLMHKTKAETFALANELGILDRVITDTLTCYNGNEEQHEWGKGCTNCPACKLREQGWQEYQRQ